MLYHQEKYEKTDKYSLLTPQQNYSVDSCEKQRNGSFQLDQQSQYISNYGEYKNEGVFENEYNSWDGLQEVQQTIYPFSPVGQIKSWFRNPNNLDELQESLGTGFLIENNAVATASHNVYCIGNKIFAEKVSFIPLAQIYGESGKQIEVSIVFVPREYQKLMYKVKRQKYDYAMLILNTKEPLIHQYCRFKLQSVDSNLLNCNLNFQIYGFPSIKNQQKHYKSGNAGKVQVYKLYKSEGLLQLRGDFLEHKISTQIGHSGSPIIRIKKQKGMSQYQYQLIGIHIAALRFCNRGIWITDQIIERFICWGYCIHTENQEKHQLIKMTSDEKQRLYERFFTVEWKQKFGEKKILDCERRFLEISDPKKLVDIVRSLLVSNTDYPRALRMCSRAYDIARFDTKRLQISSQAMHLLSYLFYSEGQCQKAIQFCNRSLVISQKLHGKASNAYLKSILNKGSYYFNMYDNENALICFEKARKYNDKMRLKNEINQITILNNMGRLFSQMGMLEQSNQKLKELLLITQRNEKENSYKYMHLSNIGDVYRKKGDLHTARSFLQKALSVFQQRNTRINLVRAYALNFMALLLRDQAQIHELDQLLDEPQQKYSKEKINQALTVLKQAKHIYEVILGKNNKTRQYIQVCQNLHAIQSIKKKIDYTQ